MTAQPDPYVRVYQSILTDTRFEGVYEDDAAFAAWVRLLMVADGAYPAPAHLPATTKRTAIKRLSDAGLIELLPRGLYRVHGLEAERKKRSERARRGATAMHEQRTAGANAVQEQSGSSANAVQLPSRTEPSRTEPSSAEAYAALEEVTHLPMQRVEWKTRQELDRLTDQRGGPVVAAAIREVAERIPTQPPSARQVVFEAVKHLEPFSQGPKTKPNSPHLADLQAATEVV